MKGTQLERVDPRSRNFPNVPRCLNDITLQLINHTNLAKHIKVREIFDRRFDVKKLFGLIQFMNRPMENSKIPKAGSGIRPPTRYAATSSRIKTLPNIKEGEIPSTSKVPPQVPSLSKVPPHQARNLLLRRRSKSVTDLRPVSAKPLANLLKPSTTTTTKSAQKRPLATVNGNEPVKPKIAKVKVPSWDYKTRFLGLQDKHTVLQEEIKEARRKVAEQANTLEQLAMKTQENERLAETIQTLEETTARLQNENQSLKAENYAFQKSLGKMNEKHNELKNKHEVLNQRYEELKQENVQSQNIILNLEGQVKGIEARKHQLLLQVEQLTGYLEEHEELRRTMHNTIQDLKGNIRVFCRIRPAISDDERIMLHCPISYPDESSLEIGKPQSQTKQEFAFDRVFPPEAGQIEVFEDLSQLVQSALDGYHVCVFAYGQTGSGKTYTMQGTVEERGMIPRTIDLIFHKIDKLKISGWTYTVKASFLEIYNESIKDLLDPSSGYNHDLKYNEGRGVTVTNLRIVPIGSAAELMKLMDEAHTNRAVATTDFNEHSSRSHAVTKIVLEGHNETSKLKYSGSIHLVDLAGSESAKTSSAERLTETKNINKSLSALGSVMLALHNKDAHVPYRNSKLTFLLQSSLGGNSKTLMFVNIAPFADCYHESINSLRFASKVKDVKITAKKSKAYTTSTHT